ncbi:MAG TPA: undecaprenyl-phosphate glucose phosphotransferase [Thermoanaerobaculia bacterium]|nr:undecaprenyl-phosphate glucose phosphotransferase [Thermoanaerobaculia bacterium]
MIQRKHKALSSIYLLIDASASCGAMLVAYFLRFIVQVIPVTKGPQPLTTYLDILPVVTLVFPLAFAVQGLYRIRATRSRAEEWLNVLIGSVIGTVFLSGLLLWIRPGGENPHEIYSRATLAIFLLCEIVLVTLGRSIVRSIRGRQHLAGRNLDRVLIAGNGDLALAAADRIAAHRELGFHVVGFLSSNDSDVLDGLTRLGSIDDAEFVIQRHQIDHVFVALPQDSSGMMLSLLDRLVRSCVSVHVVPDLLQYMAVRSRVEDIDGLATINLSDIPLEGWSRFVKRGLDIVVSSAAMVLLFPLLAFIALRIFLEDRGSVFYWQERMGLDGAPFDILKFRSMQPGAEQDTGPIWAGKDDPRRTRAGRWMRSWSLDELPQLWNVLVGDMSLVGPRPERPQFVQQFREEFPHYMLRHKVRAGITGWAQVHGWRGNTSIRMRIEHDLYYIENWSLLLDLKILVMTLRHGFRHENAY